jgi:hypothetical protein
MQCHPGCSEQVLALQCMQKAKLMAGSNFAEKNEVVPARFRHTTFCVDTFWNNYILGLVPWRTVENLLHEHFIRRQFEGIFNEDSSVSLAQYTTCCSQPLTTDTNNNACL